MDKKSIDGIRFDFSININRVNDKVSVPRYRCKRYCFMYETDFIKLIQ